MTYVIYCSSHFIIAQLTLLVNVSIGPQKKQKGLLGISQASGMDRNEFWFWFFSNGTL